MSDATSAARLNNLVHQGRVNRKKDLGTAARHTNYFSEDSSLTVRVSQHGNESIDLAWASVEVDARSAANAGPVFAADASNLSTEGVWLYIGQVSVLVTRDQADALAIRRVLA